MKTSLRTPRGVLILSGALLFLGAGCSTATTTTVPPEQTQTPPASNTPATPPTTPPPTAPTPSNQVNFFVPQDIPTYMQAEGAYSQDPTGADPAASVSYVENTTTTNPGDDPMRAAVQAAVELLPAGGGPPHANVVYFKVVAGTAYVLFDTDFNGWAGVSAFEAAMQPVVIKNLQQFSAITSVQFAPAPGDSRDQIEQTLPQQ